MKVRVKHVPETLKPEGRKILREELKLARDQVLALYASDVVEKIHETKPFKPVDEGNLHTGIMPVKGPGLTGTVTVSPVTQPYAVVQELGRRPNQPGPPLEPILRWVLRKGIATGKAAERAARAIRHSLHTRGMAGRFFFRRARADRTTRRKARGFVAAAVRRFLRRASA